MEQKNNPRELNDLGYMLYFGEGMEENESKAIELFQRAVKMGLPEAMINLGWIYTIGVGIKQNCKKAIELFERAAKLGNPYAMDNLELLYEHFDKDTLIYILKKKKKIRK
jgi:hypothetical protein